MSDASGAATSAPQNPGSSSGGSQTASPLMKVFIVCAVIVALLALIIMFVFVSHQTTQQNEASTGAQATTTQQQSSKTNTEGTLGPIVVDKSSLYNRENAALGKTGPGPKSVITGAEVDIPSTSAPNSNN